MAVARTDLGAAGLAAAAAWIAAADARSIACVSLGAAVVAGAAAWTAAAGARSIARASLGAAVLAGVAAWTTAAGARSIAQLEPDDIYGARSYGRRSLRMRWAGPGLFCLLFALVRRSALWRRGRREPIVL